MSTDASTATLPRIAIIGGGVGSVTAAFQLSSPGWRKHFRSITLYQQGWRLGGKGASGRGPGLRIEEHGLHIWFGFYENAFRMMDACHQELDGWARRRKPRWPLAFTNVEDSFQPFREISLTDHDGCNWKFWTADFFEFSDDRPWQERGPGPPGSRSDEWSVEYYAGRCLHLAADLAWSLLDSHAGLRIGAVPPAGMAREWETLDEAAGALWGALGGPVQGILRAAGGVFDWLSVKTIEEPDVLGMLDLVFQGLQIVLDYFRGRFDQLVRDEDDVRRAWYVVDVMVAIVRGLIEDGVIAAGSFDVVNDIDFREWLLSHGARDESADCALVRTVIYDLAFAYRGGDPQRPACEAGTALRGLLRTFFDYRGALMWKMNSGMGDTIFAPLYELLVKRGVKVEFFNRVETVRAADGGVQEIEIDVQATVPSGTTPRDYLRPRQSNAPDPALWPSDPSYLLGTRGKKRLEPAVYESWYADPEKTRARKKVLKRGDGFDLVVFGLPISCVEKIASDLPAQSERWKAAVATLETVPTQAVQLWLTKPATQLYCAGRDTRDGIVAGGFVEPFDTWADMHHLVKQERVRGSRTVAYFCNVLADSPAPPRGQADEWLGAQQEHVRQQALRFLSRDIASLWPKGTNALTRELFWELLVGPSDASDEDRLDAQFLRVNVEPSERYVLSVPGSSAHRIAPDDTDFENLYAVGDWTACTINAGCVEAAVISGMTAANGIFRAIGAGERQTEIIGGNGP